MHPQIMVALPKRNFVNLRIRSGLFTTLRVLRFVGTAMNTKECALTLQIDPKMAYNGSSGEVFEFVKSI